MARYSPRARVSTTVPGVFDALNEIIDRGGEVVEERRRRARQDEQDQLRQDQAEAALDRQGYRRGTAPREAVPEEEDIFAGESFGMARDVAREREQPGFPDIFAGERPGMARGGGEPQSPLVEGLGRIAEGEVEIPRPQDDDDVLALPGAFVAGQGFVPRAIRKSELVRARREAIRRASPRERVRPGYEQVGENVYSVPEREGTVPRETGELEDRTRFTEEELRTAGVPDDMIPAALFDPTLARQLIAQAARGGGEPRPPSAADRRLSIQEIERQRNAVISDLIVGGANDREILAAVNRRFEEAPVDLSEIRDIRGQQRRTGEPDDPRKAERRERIIELAGDPVELGGGRALELTFQQLVEGVSVETIRRQLAEAAERGMDAQDVANVTAYLDRLVGSGF